MINNLTPEQTADLEQYAMHRAKLAEEIKNLEDLRKEYDDKIADLAGDGTTHAGAYKVTVTRAKRLDTKKLEAAYPVIQHPELYKQAIDTAKAKAAAELGQLTLADFQTTGSPTVRIS
ncbi:hypothetical protein GCM10009592_28350 [Brachybacterium rhamnosum]|uniref:Uncharacterized protein n=1 Tax=Brachybacterium rhamnosum TaxID=173361 RepID=A0ABW4Q1H1_9MICO